MSRHWDNAQVLEKIIFSYEENELDAIKGIRKAFTLGGGL
jgi:hypothetical protein